MAEYIEREALMKYPIRIDHYDKEHVNKHFVFGIESVMEYAEALPAADVVPVVHGLWIDHMIRDWRCSLCGEKLLGRGYDGYGIKNLPNYCPNCGARMRGE